MKREAASLVQVNCQIAPPLPRLYLVYLKERDLDL